MKESVKIEKLVMLITGLFTHNRCRKTGNWRAERRDEDASLA